MALLNRTEFEPIPERSVRGAFAASACAALAVGFGMSSLIVLLRSGARSKLFRANALITGISAGAAIASLASHVLLPSRRHSFSLPAIADQSRGLRTDYSIIIPVYNRPNDLRTLLNSISAICAGAAHLGSGEVIVIDDGSTDETASVARAMIDTMSIPTRVVSKKNGGVSSGRNLGFALAGGDVGIVIDSDCVPEETWLESMLEAVRSDQKVLAFGRIRAGKRPAFPLENLPDRRGFVGASYAMVRQSYLELGGCYERYGASHDDLDLLLSALAQGYSAAHASDGWICHPLRRETIGSIWRAGLNSRFGNLLAKRHGAQAVRITVPTAYFFFGIGGNYGSSVAFIVTIANVVLATCVFILDRPKRTQIIRDGFTALAVLAGLYTSCLVTLGVLTRASVGDLPAYVATLATFQVASMLGRLRGTVEFGLPLL